MNENSLDNKDIYNMPIEEQVSFTKLDSIISIVSVILGFLFIKFAIVNTTGFLTTMVFDLITTMIIVYIKKNGYKIFKRNILNLVVIYLFSLVYSITANSFIKFLNSIFLILQITYTVYRLCDSQSKSPRFYFYVQMKSLFSYPFANFGKCPKVISNLTFKNSFGRSLKWIILGLIVTTPITFIVANLLIIADEKIEKIFINIMNCFWNNLNISLIFQILFGFLIGCGIFSLMYTNIYKKNFSVYDDNNYEIKLNSCRFCPSIMVYSALTPLCMLYILYIISQIEYFMNAFSGNLYGNYSYSEYARRGFFELSAIAFINLIVIFVANTFCKRMGISYHDKKPMALKIYSIIFDIFTIFIISTAISKMFLYITEYGLTRLRIYTSWFMILLALVFITLIVREFKDFNLSNLCRVIFIIMFGILCFSRVDRIIVETNISLYESGKIQNLDIIDLKYGLSDDAYVPIIKYITKNNNDNYFQSNYDNLIKSSYDRYNVSSIEFINTYEKYYK